MSEGIFGSCGPDLSKADTRQADTVPRWKVLALLEAAKDTPLDPPGDEWEWLIDQVKAL